MVTSLPKILRRIEPDPAPATGSVARPVNDFQTFLVQCDTFRCLAYKDEQGRWRSVHDNRELQAVKHVVSTLQ